AGDADALHRHWTDPGVRRFLWDDVVISPRQAVCGGSVAWPSRQTAPAMPYLLTLVAFGLLVGTGTAFALGFRPPTWKHAVAAVALAFSRPRGGGGASPRRPPTPSSPMPSTGWTCRRC